MTTIILKAKDFIHSLLLKGKNIGRKLSCLSASHVATVPFLENLRRIGCIKLTGYGYITVNKAMLLVQMEVLCKWLLSFKFEKYHLANACLQINPLNNWKVCQCTSIGEHSQWVYIITLATLKEARILKTTISHGNLNHYRAIIK